MAWSTPTALPVKAARALEAIQVCGRAAKQP
jgi:hypothetical protein